MNPLIKYFLIPVGSILLFCFISIAIVFIKHEYESDDYDGCSFYLNVDKNVTAQNDTLKITLLINQGENVSKTIKMYSDLSNFELYGRLNCESFDNIIENTYKTTNNNKKVQTVKLVTNEPYAMTFEAFVFYDKQSDTIQLTFPILKKELKFTYSDYQKCQSFKISGFLEPIKPPFGYSFEDYINGTEIKFRF